MPLYFAQSEGINPITSSWKSREVKQIEVQKLPEIVHIIQQQAISYIQSAKNVYPLNDKLHSHLCQKTFQVPAFVCSSWISLLKLAFSVVSVKN